MSQVINDYQLMKISSFIDGELEINEIKELLREMDKNPNLKDAYFKLFDLSLASKELTNTSIKKKHQKFIYFINYFLLESKNCSALVCFFPRCIFKLHSC